MFGILLTFGLTQMGCHSDTKSADNHNHSHEGEQGSSAETEKPPMQVTNASLAADADLDKVVEEAVSNIQKGRETGDMSLVMNEGIMKLKAVTERDSNHVAAIYQLGLMSIESGQTQKAIKRFEKLLLLQPENQEYKKILEDLKG